MEKGNGEEPINGKNKDKIKDGDVQERQDEEPLKGNVKETIKVKWNAMCMVMSMMLLSALAMNREQNIQWNSSKWVFMFRFYNW